MTRRRRGERGAELVEMALALPLLLLVVLSIVDFAFMFQQYLVLTNAAMEGARVAVLPGYAPNDAVQRAQAYATAGGVPSPVNAVANAVPLPAPTGSWPGMQVTVTHEYQFQFLGPMASWFNSSLGSVTLTARSTVRRQMGS
ncbi:MAG: TadE/TadG family type IV pilus assembly protein [Vicinamibacterales bacterium]